MKRIYPWEEWFRQRKVVLTSGTHYRCSQSTMAQIIRNNASARGWRVQLTDTGAGFVVTVIGRRACEISHTDKAAVPG